MSTNINFKEIWNKQKPEIPEVEILYNKANRFKRNNLYKLVTLNLLFIIVFIIIGSIWYFYQPKLVTTKIGIILTIIAMIIFIVSNSIDMPMLFKNNISFSSKDYLQQLIKLKERQIFQQTTMLGAYFLFLSLGIGLYIFEYVSDMTIIWGIIIYLITIIWFAINWFYLRPKVIKKQNDKLNKLLVEFKKLDNQMLS